MADRSKVLLLEGNQTSALSLAAAIRDKGWEVVFASDTVVALDVARRAKPDAMVLSGLLPGGGGLVALKRIRTNVYTAVIPVIAISGPTGPQKKEFLAAGAQECVEQPVDPALLCSLLQKQMARKLSVAEAPVDSIRDPARMMELENTGLLNSAPEMSFDSLTALASKLLGTPVALMSLVDKDRQFFKSQVGLPDPWAKERQTPLSHSFCQWVVAGKERLSVSDAREHPLLRDNLAVRDLGVIAYAGIPLSGGRDQAIGSFCAIDTKPRAWTEEDLQTLHDLAQIVEAHIILRQSAAAESAGKVSTIAKPAPAKLMEAAGKAIAAATRILGRGRQQLGSAERSALQAIVKSQGEELLRLAGALR